MGLLSQEYYDNLAKEPVSSTKKPEPTAPAAPTATAPDPVAPRTNLPDIGTDDPYYAYVFGASSRPLTVPGSTPPVAGPSPLLTPTRSEDSQIKEYGGAVGSTEYYRYKAEHPLRSFLPQQIGSSFGLRFPDQETWDKMGFLQRSAWTAKEIPLAAGRMIKELPREVVKAPLRVGITIAAPWAEMAKGNSGTIEDVQNAPVVQLPWLGAVPSYFQSYKQASDSGMGKYAATLMTIGTAAGDVAIAGSLAEGLNAAVRPRAKLVEGQTIKNVEPVKQAFIEEQNKVIAKRAAVDSTAEYYSIPNTVAKDFGGKTNNTFVKITPAGESTVELSVVQTRGGAIPRGIDYVKNKLGVPDKTYTGSFGPEVKVQSQIIDVGRTVMKSTEGATPETTLAQIPPKALKGFETKPITDVQMTHLADIAKVNGVNPGIRDAVIRTISGKRAVGDLTQADYVKSAQVLAKFNNASKFAPEAPGMNWFNRAVSPQRHWMRAYEEKGGLPIYSEVYVPMEEGIRLRNVFRSSYRNEAREVFGKYAKSGFGEERRLIKAYMEGDTSAVTGNAALSEATKSDIIGIAGKLRVLYDKVGQQLDVPPEIFLKDYQPHIQDLGGVFQLYRDGATQIPKELEFFAKFKRHGNVGVSVDDSLALFDIYTNAGSNRTFLNPVLERIGKISGQLPKEIHNSVRNYTLERMGYAGKLEQYLDKAAANVNKSLGTSLPPDTARQLTTLAMDTTYSGALGLNPGKAVRNLLQTDLITYPRLGPEYYIKAAKAALDPKMHAEVRAKGFLVELGVPYGEELSKDITLGGKLGNAYRKITQSTLGPYSMADQVNRVRTYAQLKFQFQDALAKYNAGKIGWKQLENKLDFNAYGQANRQIIRSRLVNGDIEGAFDNMVREVLDETQFPYRRGASGQITYGLTGKITTQFMQWPLEFIHTHARWLKTGQYDKLIRFWGSSAAISRSLRDAAGIDETNVAYYNPISPSFAPAVRSAVDFVDMLNGMAKGNAEQTSDAKDSLARAVKTLAVPAGASINNVRDFFKSYSKGPTGPNGEYGVYDQRGRLQYYAPFSELWLRLWGFPTNQQQDTRNVMKEISNAQFDYTQAKQDVLELYQQERYDEANAIIEQHNIQLSPGDFDKYYIPLTQRTFQALPATLKAQFVPKVYPTE